MVAVTTWEGVSLVKNLMDFIMQFSKLLDSLSIRHTISEKKILCNGKICTVYRVYFCVDKTMSCF